MTSNLDSEASSLSTALS